MGNNCCAGAGNDAPASRKLEGSFGDRSRVGAGKEAIILGAGEQGKATLSKQARLHFGAHNQRLDSFERQTGRTIVRHNLAVAIESLVEVQKTLTGQSGFGLGAVLRACFQSDLSEEGAAQLQTASEESLALYNGVYEQCAKEEGFGKLEARFTSLRARIETLRGQAAGDDDAKRSLAKAQRELKEAYAQHPVLAINSTEGKRQSQPSIPGVDPSSQQFLDRLMDQAAEAQALLKASVLGRPDVVWEQKNLETGASGVVTTPNEWIDEAFDPGVKRRDRVQLKAQYKYGGNFGDVRDVCRVALQFRSFANLRGAYDLIMERFDVVEVENRFRTPTGLGWRDVTILVRLKLRNGVKHIGEVQLQLLAMAQARRKAHKWYKQVRSILEEAVPVKEQEFVLGCLDLGPLDALDNQHPDAWLLRYGERWCSLGVHLPPAWGLGQPEQRMWRYARPFMEDFQRVMHPDYLPTPQDFLRIRIRTGGIIEHEVAVEGVSWTLALTGGQRSERRKWIHVMKEGVGVVFVVSLVDFALVLYEDGATNRMQDSLELLHKISEVEQLSRSRFAVFLSFKDEFAEVLKHTNIADKPQFADFDGRANHVDDGVEYFRGKVLQQFEDQSRVQIHVVPSMLDEEHMSSALRSAFEFLGQPVSQPEAEEEAQPAAQEDELAAEAQRGD